MDDIRVVDFSRMLPGAYSTMLLADFGADVIKVERPPDGDPIRHVHDATDGQSGRHRIVNRGKRSVAADLKSRDDVDAVKKLIKSADIVVESFRPGVMDRLGLSYAELSSINPRLIYVSLTGYGQEGPRSGQPSHDINYLAESGFLSLAGLSDAGTPCLPPLQVADMAGGSLMAVIGMLLALRVRDRTGQGQHVDVSMLDGLLSLLGPAMGDAGDGGTSRNVASERVGGRQSRYRVYRTSDDMFVAVGALEPKFFNRLLALLGLDDGPGTSSSVSGEHVGPDRLAQRFAQISSAEVVESLESAGVCVSLVRTLDEVTKDSTLLERGAIVAQARGDGEPHGSGRQPGVTPRLSIGGGVPGGLPEPVGGSSASSGWHTS